MLAALKSFYVHCLRLHGKPAVILPAFLLLAACLLFSPGFCRDDSLTANTAGGSKPVVGRVRKEMLWKMTSASGATLYLLGTIHVFKAEDYPLPVEMEKAFAKAKALVVEVDLTDSNPVFTRAFIVKNGKYEAPDDLTHHLSSRGLQLLRQYCLSHRLSFESFLSLKPWIVAITILEKELARLGYDSKNGIDLHFISEANEMHKRVISLETAEFQLKLFADLPDDLQEQDLELGLLDVKNTESDAAKMMKAWREGDEKSMEEIMSKDVKEHPELSPIQEKLLYERNITMARDLEAYLKNGKNTYMVAIGTGHLIGDRSVIKLLQSKGYEVQQIYAGASI